MPNWCLNRAEIRHKDPAQLNRLIRAYAEGGRGVGQEFLPPPSDGDKCDWRICHWGTKSDFVEGETGAPAAALPGGVRLNFDTAWDAPLGIYLELLRQGFEVDGLYWEPGYAWCGRVEGPVVRHFNIRSPRIAEIRKHVDAELIEEFAMEEYYATWEDEEDDPELGESSTESWEAQLPLDYVVTKKAAVFRVSIALMEASMKDFGV